MTGIERLRELGNGISPFVEMVFVTLSNYCIRHNLHLARGRDRFLRDNLLDIADQIERETIPRKTGDVSMSAYDLLPQEERDAIAWVRDHGGLERVKWLLDWCLSHGSKIEQLDFDFWLSGRVMHELDFEGDLADRDEVERRLRDRLMPEGGWPRYEDDEMVLVGSDFADGLGETHTVTSIEFFEGCVELHWNPDEPGEFEYLHPGERVKRPAPKVLDADGVEIREKRDAWWICEGDERGVHAERLRVETIGPNGLIECSPYNGGTWVYLEPSELYVNKPVPASDGRPLREGEMVWLNETGLKSKLVDRGEPLKVVAFDKKGNVGVLDRDDIVLGETSPWWFNPSCLTHERPDSWERLEEDATIEPHAYCTGNGLFGGQDEHDPAFPASELMARDLVRRAKVLAGEA